MTAEETLNELLVGLFKDLMEIEARCLITEEFSDISINDMHIIEAIGVDEPKRSGTVAALMSITLGTLTKAIDGLTRKGYVSRIRSDEDKRVVKLSLTDKGKSAFYHHEQEERRGKEPCKGHAFNLRLGNYVDIFQIYGIGYSKNQEVEHTASYDSAHGNIKVLHSEKGYHGGDLRNGRCNGLPERLFRPVAAISK